jgi:hypothetical protein
MSVLSVGLLMSIFFSYFIAIYISTVAAPLGLPDGVA